MVEAGDFDLRNDSRHRPDGDLGASEGKKSAKSPKLLTVTTYAITNVVGALRSLTHIDDATEQPEWIVTRRRTVAKDYLVAQNGMIHVPRGRERPGHDREATPDLFTSVALDFDIDLISAAAGRVAPAIPRPVVAERLLAVPTRWASGLAIA